MVRINGVNAANRNARCRICGAPLYRTEGREECPNKDRKDHKEKNDG